MHLQLPKIILFTLLLSLAISTPAMSANIKKLTIQHTDNSHQLHTASWQNTTTPAGKTIVLLSGPIDSWHSDTAWFATLAPILAKDHRVIAIDRAGLVLAQTDVSVGYQHFAEDLQLALNQLKVNNATVISFASSNISLHNYFNNYPRQTAIKRAILIDPDALSNYSVSRYTLDAKPFKDNLQQYIEYISQKKYTSRVEQKNTADMAQLTELAKQSGTLDSTDWNYVDSLFKARLALPNQINLFKEIAIYGEELTQAASLAWPPDIPVWIIDTAFEQHYIEQTDDSTVQQQLQKWQSDAAIYYQKLTQLNKASRYLAVDSLAHLYQVAKPQNIVTWVQKFETNE